MLVYEVSNTSITILSLVLCVVAQGAAATADGNEAVGKKPVVTEKGRSRGLMIPSSRRE